MSLNPRAVAAELRRRSPLRPQLGIVLGSGFGSAVALMAVDKEIPYAHLPGFPSPRVPGHAGKVLLGRLGDLPVIALSGRAHYYEGHSLELVTFPTRVLAALGVRDLLLTNAAGGIATRFAPGDFMVITDHINLMGVNPLRGPATRSMNRFVDLSCVYDPGLRALLLRAGKDCHLRLRTGTYLAVSGPNYETPAEIRAFARLGADAVGMSTVPEAIVARQCGLRVAALSCITNLAAGRSPRAISHEEVLEITAGSGRVATRLLEAFGKQYARQPSSDAAPRCGGKGS